MTGDTLPDRPRLRGYLRRSQTDGEMTFRGGATAVTLQGESVRLLLPDLLAMLDGQRSVADLGRALPHVETTVLVGALQVLHEQNLLEDATLQDATLQDATVTRDVVQDDARAADRAAALAAQEAYWGSLPYGSVGLQGRVERASVLVIGSGVLARELADGLLRTGVGQVTGDGAEEEPDPGVAEPPDALREADVVVVCADVPRAEHLSTVNGWCVSAGRPFLPVTFGADHATVGPFVVPHQTACHECYRARLRANRSYVDDALGDPVEPSGPVRFAAPTSFAPLVAATAVGEILLHLTGARLPRTFGAFVSLRPLTPGASVHEVLKLPRCPVCGPQRYRPQMKIWDLTVDEDGPEA